MSAANSSNVSGLHSPHASPSPKDMTLPRPQSPSSALEDLLHEGDIIGEGIPLLGQPLTPVHFAISLSRQSSSDDRDSEPAPTFEVVRKLGTGSYAVVYLVREVLANSHQSNSPPSQAEDAIFDFDYNSSSTSHSSSVSPSTSATSAPVYGRDFAVKCLSKANLDEEALGAQLLEATLHQSLPVHPNIVTLHRTLESPSFLILVLEYVPGQDLFYFLESARDQYHPPPSRVDDSSGSTPTTPSLLSALHPTTLLSYTRLRLIASMFSQMCEAVAQCHRRGVYHRDIKPENLIVTDSRSLSSTTDSPYRDQKVIVKLTDFGLATTDDESSDMDCGSAPYMSFECRNNLAPTYTPRQADVWSLGIVLINMLYHHNPWSDTSLSPESACPSFTRYRALVLGEKEGRPEDFFRERFVGMSEAVATFLVRKVFCFLPVGEHIGRRGTGHRVTAEEFGKWSKNLPELFGKSGAGFGERDGFLVTPLNAPPKSRRPSLRASGEPSKPGARLLSLMRDISPSRGRSTRIRGEVEEQEEEGPPRPDPEIDERYDDDENGEDLSHSRAASGTRKRRRGARRNKGTSSANVSINGSTTNISAMVQTSPHYDDDLYSAGDRLDDMAVKSQLLARELSKTSSYLSSSHSLTAPSSVSLALSLEKSQISDGKAEKVVTPKKSKWRMFSSSNSATSSDSVPPVPVVPNLAGSSQYPSVYSYPYAQPPPTTKSIASSTSTHPPSKHDAHVNVNGSSSRSRSKSIGANSSNASTTGKTSGISGAQAANAARLAMALGPAPPRHTSDTNSIRSAASSSSLHLPPSSVLSSVPGSSASMHHDERSRGRSERGTIAKAAAAAMYSTSSATLSSSRLELAPPPPPPPRKDRDRRNISPGGPPASSSNFSWRNSMSGASTSTSTTASSTTSAFTRYSNSSVRSFDTLATSNSGSSSNWRSGSQLDVANSKVKRANGSSASISSAGRGEGGVPANVKMMNGVPHALTQLAVRGPNPQGDIFGSIPVRNNNKPQGLSTINERERLALSPPTSPKNNSSWKFGPKSPNEVIGSGAKGVGVRKDAATSTTDLTGDQDSDGPKKVQKAQINTLAKMLSALRR